MKCETMNIITHLGLAMAWQQSTIVEEVRPMVILSEICQGKKCKVYVLVAFADFAAGSHSGDT